MLQVDAAAGEGSPLFSCAVQPTSFMWMGILDLRVIVFAIDQRPDDESGSQVDRLRFRPACEREAWLTVLAAKDWVKRGC